MAKGIALSLIIITICGATVTGCASNKLDQELDAKLANEGEIRSRRDLQAQATQLIESEPALDSDRKVKLMNLKDSTRTQIDELTETSLKLRSLMIKEIASTQDNSDEIQLIKERLRKNEDKRLTVLFKAVDEATGIVGKESFQEKQRQQAVKSMVEIPYGPRAN